MVNTSTLLIATIALSAGSVLCRPPRESVKHVVKKYGPAAAEVGLELASQYSSRDLLEDSFELEAREGEEGADEQAEQPKPHRQRKRKSRAARRKMRKMRPQAEQLEQRDFEEDALEAREFDDNSELQAREFDDNLELEAREGEESGDEQAEQPKPHRQRKRKSRAARRKMRKMEQRDFEEDAFEAREFDDNSELQAREFDDISELEARGAGRFLREGYQGLRKTFSGWRHRHGGARKMGGAIAEAAPQPQQNDQRDFEEDAFEARDFYENPELDAREFDDISELEARGAGRFLREGYQGLRKTFSGWRHRHGGARKMGGAIAEAAPQPQQNDQRDFEEDAFEARDIDDLLERSFEGLDELD